MRIWSKRLIPVLPTKQLKAMRYELGDMIKQYPNIKHPLVKFANNYNSSYLYIYFDKVCNELKKRNIKMNDNYNKQILHQVNLGTDYCEIIPINYDDNFTFKEDNEEYLKICYWNLYEKHLRKMITDEEWQKIDEYYTREIMGYGN